MHDINFFNGQDITMNVCIQIHRVINLIQKQENIGFEEATGKFYHSQTYKTLTQVENGLWAENAEYILDCHNEEAKN
ncbi:MAG: hypothetical protein ACLR0A_12025 [Faecalibacillus intestinalis]|uniref:hypothetical protein n=1 Tax=Faecalibacillus intestinalis TaxID=1982626 RepID=UPI00399ACE85